MTREQVWHQCPLCLWRQLGYVQDSAATAKFNQHWREKHAASTPRMSDMWDTLIKGGPRPA